MKSEKLFKILLCVFVAISALFSFSISAFAENDIISDGNSDTYEETQEVIETEPITEPLTEPPTEETTVYTEPATEPAPEETEPTTEEVTDTVPDETEPVTEEVQATETSEEENNYWYGGVEETSVNPTQLSTSMVSMKPYETNYAAGVVSWVCVIIGVIVIVTVLISTKHSGKKLRANEDYYSVRR